jgi:hypothetical protein
MERLHVDLGPVLQGENGATGFVLKNQGNLCYNGGHEKAVDPPV